MLYGDGDVASMRPQHITAETGRTAGADAGGAVASMRPQHITAETSLKAKINTELLGLQ